MAELKDSGTREEFGTGAVRDVQEGKGRCDLLPLDILAGFIAIKYPNRLAVSVVLNNLYEFQETGDMYHLFNILYYVSGCDNYMWNDPSSMFLDVAIHYEDGARKYGDNNWKKGIPVSRYISSAVRHYLKYLRHDNDEPHDRAFVWNIMAACWTCKHKPELNDYRKESVEDADNCSNNN